MEPGPELSAAVAEKIMGWNNPCVHEGELMMLHPNPTPSSSYCPPDSFSIDLTAAWEVVEKLRGQGYSIDVHAYPEGRKWLKPLSEGAPAREWKMVPETTHFYQCTITALPLEMGCWVVVADCVGLTSAHAICLSALEAKTRKDLYEQKG